jgi:zinc protease
VFAGPKETPPQGPPPKPFHLPATTDFTLPNGMQVTIVPTGLCPKSPCAPSWAGAIDESAGQVWLSKLNAALMKEGTTHALRRAVAREAAEMGGQLEVEAGSDFTSVGGVVLSDFGPKFVALLADVLAAIRRLPAAELPRLKADLVRDSGHRPHRARALARERFLKTLFPDHPYGRIFPPRAICKATPSRMRRPSTGTTSRRAHASLYRG